MFGLVWDGLVWFGSVRFGLVWFDFVWCGVVCLEAQEPLRVSLWGAQPRDISKLPGLFWCGFGLVWSQGRAGLVLN
jgi:hypothetical protein